MNPTETGILYYARGDKWIQEAVVSARSAKVRMPAIPIAIVTDHDMPESLFDVQIRHPAELDVKQLKMWAMKNSPFTRTLYLDTDTYVADALWEIFSLLDNFHLGAAVTPYWRIGLQHEGAAVADDGIAVAFPKLNAGVVVYRNDKDMLDFLDRWATRHKEQGLGQDQPSFRHTLYHSSVRFCVLPMAYNYRLPYPAGIGGKIKVFHGHVREIEKISLKLNRTPDWRTGSPARYRRNRFYYPFGLKRPRLSGKRIIKYMLDRFIK